MSRTEQAAQVFIAIFGVTAVYLSQTPDVARYACIFGLLSQPFFFYVTIRNGLWGMTILNVLYAISWGHGLFTWWIR